MVKIQKRLLILLCVGDVFISAVTVDIFTDEGNLQYNDCYREWTLEPGVCVKSLFLNYEHRKSALVMLLHVNIHDCGPFHHLFWQECNKISIFFVCFCNHGIKFIAHCGCYCKLLAQNLAFIFAGRNRSSCWDIANEDPNPSTS